MSQTKQSHSEQKQEKTHEYHVASLVAYAMPEQVSDVEAAINAIDGAEIHATSDKGKIVLTIEGDSHKGIGKKMDLLRVHKGLINLSPVYHQVLDEKIDENKEENYQEIK
ncbi:nitrate reductase formation protein NapD [Colwellia psychrerythraea]|uniref:Chaperone NapD n=1 Tax=Colwellia psychrerythraea TaxID=28229 RepID=A0A1Y5ENW1_COLPS|nr:nitrate reductase formation protein NapD [Colwellia psychrerythraea]